jgi:glycosyltransferase involved in cell wall biosynthesis
MTQSRDIQSLPVEARPSPAIPLVSVIVLTYNEQANLPDCLESLRGLHCEIFVLDSGSSDRTLDIARQYRVQIAEHPFENYARQRNWAQLNLPTTCDWLLHLDADERLTPGLVEEINQILARPEIPADGFLFRKRTIFMGRWIKHGGHYPSHHLRLFRKGKGGCEDRLYDQHFLVDGKVESLRNDYLDIVSSSLNTWTVRHVRWAELEASEMMSKENVGDDRVRAAFFGNPIQRRRWLREDLYSRGPLFVRPFLYWWYRYFLRLGFLDGKEGLIFHFLQGCWFRFLTDAYIYERRKSVSHNV